MVSTTDLIEPLAQRGIQLNRSPVHQLVAGKPQRADIWTLLAPCDILGCRLTDIAVRRETAAASVAAKPSRPRRQPALAPPGTARRYWGRNAPDLRAHACPTVR